MRDENTLTTAGTGRKSNPSPIVFTGFFILTFAFRFLTPESLRFSAKLHSSSFSFFLHTFFMLRLPILHQARTYEVRPSKIIAVGLNYREHLPEHDFIHGDELSKHAPREPVLFVKTPNVLIGPEEPIRLPSGLEEAGFPNPRTDFEAELAFFIKDRCRNVPEEEAYAHILGFTAMNDVSQRDLQKSDVSGWFRGKCLDTFGPIGPALVLMEDIGDPQNLAISARLNGQVKQSASTAQMIFPIRTLLAYISRFFTLEPGDLIVTGTPAGVDALHPGDVVEIEIEKIGTLRNPVIQDPQT